ncbi:protein phosphatase 1 regulatory subunit 3C-like [Rhinophrynus dorsalis]
MPGDFSVCLRLSPPTQPRLHCPSADSLRSCLLSTPRHPDNRKKAVVFADALGKALTTVRYITRPLFDEDPLGFALVSLRALLPLASPTYILDFPLPTQDYTFFREKLFRQLVCLEQCAVQGAAVAGTVRVQNIGYEKHVTLRATYDGWQSHHDLPCSYLRDLCGGGDTDTFSFRLTLPIGTVKAEFCICFWCEGKKYWDNNNGKNYALHKEADRGGYRQRPYW